MKFIACAHKNKQIGSRRKLYCKGGQDESHYYILIKDLKVVPITFAIKKEIEKLEVEIVQKKSNLTSIPKLIQKHTIKHPNYLYYRWVQQSSLLQMP